MLKKTLGKTGLNVSVIGFGGIPIQRLDQLKATEIILECKNQGINFIDTAEAYGRSEEFIGEALKIAGRENFYIATKAVRYTYEDMKKAVDDSLKRLQIEYIDLYQIHHVSSDEKYEKSFSEWGALKALIEAKQAGKIKHIGITSHGVRYLEKAIQNENIETIQFPFNPVESQGIELFKKAKEKNMGIIAMKPVAGGAITNVSLSLRYITNSDLITVAIPGMDSTEQVKENALVGKEIRELTEQEKQILSKEIKELGEGFCRRCGYCGPCPQNIDIPTMFVLQGYHERYNLPQWATERYQAMPVNASDCIKCGICEDRCPYHLSIREMLEKVSKTFE